jgi:hypothetical protein
MSGKYFTGVVSNGKNICAEIYGGSGGISTSQA